MTPDEKDTKERLQTGSVELDLILGGGFPKNSINIIMGQPGAGKTVFAEQLVFHNASEGRPILYLTTMSEPIQKALKYLQHFGFFDESKLGTQVVYEDVGPALAEYGITILVDRVQQAILHQSPKIIVIDSFKPLHDLATSPSEMRQMLYKLTAMLTAYETTVFLVGEYTDEHGRQYPEFAVADGIVQFMRNSLSIRDERFMRVLKLRGSTYLEGLHGFRIKSSGLEIFPRLISPVLPADYTLARKRLHTGVEGLDQLMGGGLLEGSTLLLAGPTGSGKTTAGLQFAIEGVRAGEPSLFINFQENPTQLKGSIASLGENVEQLLAEGLHLYYKSPVELQIDSIIVNIFMMITELKVKRVVLDSVGDLMSAASDPDRLHNFLYALNQHLTVAGVTTILTYELPGGITGNTWTTAANQRFSYMADSILVLSLDVRDRVKRSLAVVKQRASGHDLGVHEFEITDRGLRVLPEKDS